MRRKYGMLYLALGTVLIIGALSLFLSNQHQATRAEQHVAAVLPELHREIQNRGAANAAEYMQPLAPKTQSGAMAEVVIDGYGYIGCLSIPVLGLELPVMADWDDTRLSIAPCCYAGSIAGDDLVIMAHNYPGQFSRLSELTAGDCVIFTDADGVARQYRVTETVVLAPQDVEEINSGKFALTLFTCTYGGQNRIAVHCDRFSGA